MVKHLKKVLITPEFGDTDPDELDDEQGPAVKHPKKASRAPEYSGDEQRPAVNYQRCIVMYSAEDEQKSAVKKHQKYQSLLIQAQAPRMNKGPQENSLKKHKIYCTKNRLNQRKSSLPLAAPWRHLARISSHLV